jgi:fermentation-respiration switch protein FrsA (DUF1100 family)
MLATMKLAVRILTGIAVVAVLAYGIVMGVMYVFQRDFQYDRSGRMFELSETKLSGAELVSIPSADGSAVTGWYEPPTGDMPVILYFRGNSQSFSREHVRYEAFTEAGYGFLAFDYRGFPGSPGELTEENVLADALAAYDWLAAKGFPILIWGRSLGSGPSTYTASQRDARALLLETPFDSAVAVAADRYGFLPVGLLMHDQYPVDQWILDVEEPVFVAHGTADRTVGVQHGERVYELAPNKAGIWIEPGADHADLWAAGIWERAQAFFAEVINGTTAERDEIVLDYQIDPQRPLSWLPGAEDLQPVSELGEEVVEGLREPVVDLATRMQPEDELWRVYSKDLGTLSGWEGVALIRYGFIVEMVVPVVH